MKPPERRSLAVLVYQEIAPRYRVVLLFAVVLVSIFSSRIANDPTEIGSWLIVVGAGAFMYLADVFREIEDAAGALVLPGKSLSEARRDVITARVRGRRSSVFVGAVVLVASGLVLLVVRAPR